MAKALAQRRIDFCLGLGGEGLSRELPGFETLTPSLATLGRLYAAGVDLRWEMLTPANGRCVRLPAYPWQKQRLWVVESQWTAPGDATRSHGDTEPRRHGDRARSLRVSVSPCSWSASRVDHAVCRSANEVGENVGRGLVGRAGNRGHRHPRQLLRAWRRFAAGDDPLESTARRPSTRNPRRSRAVRGPDHCRPGRVCSWERGAGSRIGGRRSEVRGRNSAVRRQTSDLRPPTSGRARHGAQRREGGRHLPCDGRRGNQFVAWGVCASLSPA